MLDSNLIIYAARLEYPGLRRLIAARSPAVSVISVVGVLGYHKLSEEDRRHFEAFFAAAKVLPISDAVVARAVSLRQRGFSGFFLRASVASFRHGLARLCSGLHNPGITLLLPVT